MIRGAYLFVLALVLGAGSASAADWQARGRDQLARGEVEQAVVSFDEAKRINPFDPVALNNLAVVKAAHGDYLTALDLLRRAVGLAPHRRDIADNYERLRAWTDSHGPVVAGSLDAMRKYPLVSANIPPEPPPLWETAVPIARPAN